MMATTIPNPLVTYFGLIYYISDYYKSPELKNLLFKVAMSNLQKYHKNGTLNIFFSNLDITDHRFIKVVTEACHMATFNIDFEDKSFGFLSRVILEKYPKKENLCDFITDYLPLLKDNLAISHPEHKLMSDDLIQSMNYSLSNGGKRIRPILVFLTAREFGIPPRNILAYAKAIEYLHTSSLILDDLPSQDDSKMRRGTKTNHLEFNVATAELASVSLIAEAIREITTMSNYFDPLDVNKVIHYVTEKIGHKGLSYGQLLDLNAKGKRITVGELEEITYLKTGIAIEATLVPIAILAKQKTDVIAHMLSFARHLGLMFQIRDDILDITGTPESLGKDAHIDDKNQCSTYAQLLGIKGAELLLSQYKSYALTDLKNLPFKSYCFVDLVELLDKRPK